MVREVLRLEGLGTPETNVVSCSLCEVSLELTEVHRCRDCHVLSLQCTSCMVQTHAANPLHRIEVSLPKAKSCLLSDIQC
jgi:hypothetical protein